MGPLSGSRILRRRVLSIRSDFGMATRRPPGSELGAHARHCLGVRPLFCGHHGCQLEIPLHPAHRILNRDYIVFDCGSMASSKAGHDRSVAIAERKIRLATAIKPRVVGQFPITALIVQVPRRFGSITTSNEVFEITSVRPTDRTLARPVNTSAFMETNPENEAQPKVNECIGRKISHLNGPSGRPFIESAHDLHELASNHYSKAP